MSASGEKIEDARHEEKDELAEKPFSSKRESRVSSSSSDGQGVEHEKVLAGQAAMPVQVIGAQDVINPLSKLDSKVVLEVKDKDIDPFGHLPAHEADILRRQIDIPEVASGYWTLYRYATRNDLIIFGVSCICTIAAGAAMPLMTVLLF
jgi:ATP-binding cassette subfamily B (MDR/TAP) protein 1